MTALFIASCGTTPSPSPAAVMGRDWGKATSVGVPPENAGTLPAQDGPHPIHFQGGQADMVAVTQGGPGFVAAGYLDPDIIAAAWTSTDGLGWTLVADVPASEGTLAASVAAGPAGIVAVGSDGAHAAAWHSAEGTHWTQAQAQASLTASPQIRMTSAVATADGFLAAGYVGSLTGPITAAFWRSADGATWDRVPDAPSFAGGQVYALAIAPASGGSGRIVAVGARGDARRPAAAAAWTSVDGLAWDQVDLPEAENAALYAVSSGPAGMVALGNDADMVTGVAWTSADGMTWTRSPADPSFLNGGSKIELRAVTWAGTQFVAGGHRNFGTQRGTAVLWTSTDGRAWQRAPETPALGGGKLFGLAASPSRVVAVGSYGAPDLYLPTVWVSPPVP